MKELFPTALAEKREQEKEFWVHLYNLPTILKYYPILFKEEDSVFSSTYHRSFFTQIFIHLLG